MRSIKRRLKGTAVAIGLLTVTTASLVDRGTLEEETITSLVKIGWSEQTARSAAASCPAR